MLGAAPAPALDKASGSGLKECPSLGGSDVLPMCVDCVAALSFLCSHQAEQTIHSTQASTSSTAKPTPTGTPMITERCSWIGSTLVGGTVVARGVGVGSGKRRDVVSMVKPWPTE